LFVTFVDQIRYIDGLIVRFDWKKGKAKDIKGIRK